MRPPVDTITPPPFPQKLPWLNTAALRMDQQRGRPVLVEFWDLCRPASVRTSAYLRAWHERYHGQGLRVVAVHSPGFPLTQGEDVVRRGVERLGLPYPVLVDDDLRLWTAYDNEGWPARYLWAPTETPGMAHVLREFHYGEGAYRETEVAIREALGLEPQEDLLPLLRPEDDPDTPIVVPTPEQEGAYSGPYAAGAVWAVLEGAGEVVANGRAVAVDGPGAYVLIDHERHTTGVLDLEVGSGVECHAVAFTAGRAA